MTADARMSEPLVAEPAAKPPGRLTLLMRTRPELILAPVLLVVIIVVWEWGVPFFEVPNYVLPTPSAIVTALWRGLDAGLFDRGGYWLQKSRPGSPDKIDAAVAAVLAYEARADAIAVGLASSEPAELIAF